MIAYSTFCLSTITEEDRIMGDFYQNGIVTTLHNLVRRRWKAFRLFTYTVCWPRKMTMNG